jgi:hypothetical protein
MSCRKINEPKYKTRPTPPYDANECQYKVVKGNNGTDFISRPDENKSFKWYQIKYGKTPEDFFSQFPNDSVKQYAFPKKILDEISEELKQTNILFYHIGWNKVWNMIDNAWDDAELLTENSAIVKDIRKIDKISFTTDIVSFIFYTEHMRYLSEIEGQLKLQHNILQKDRQNVIKIFTKHFGKNFVWNKKNNKVFVIKLHKT